MIKKFQLQKIFDISIGNKVKINIWVIAIIISAYLGGYADIFFAAYSCALIHELAHIICARFLHIEIDCISIYPFGISAKLKGNYIQSSEKEFYVSFAGPICSIILFWLFSFLYLKFGHAILLYISDVNLALCVVNLIPSLPLDGGRMLKAILTLRFGIIRAYNFMIKFSRILVVFILTASIILIVISKNFSLTLICSFLLQNLTCEQKLISSVALREILSAKEKLKVIRPAKVLCVSEGQFARQILNELAFDHICIVNVIDDNCNITKTLTEAKILDTLTEKGIRTKYKDI